MDTSIIRSNSTPELSRSLEMKQDLFQFLPAEITINILSRLPVRAIAMSKCVCKPWLDLLSTVDFVNSHLSKSVSALALLMEGEKWESICCKVFEFEDEVVVDVEHRYNPLTKFDLPDGLVVDVERRYNIAGAADGDEEDQVVVDVERPLIKFDLPDGEDIAGAADGLLLLVANSSFRYNLSICNPITREFVELCCNTVRVPPKYGFGASKITGQHKVIQILPQPKPKSDQWDVSVYTVETRSWNRFEATAVINYRGMYGAFVNGNLHWLSATTIACFNLETECFSVFSAPPPETECYNESICVLKDHLCVCYGKGSEDYDGLVIEIWLMKEYGVENSWTKEYVIGIRPEYAMDYTCNQFYPIKVFNNGDILISGGTSVYSWTLFHYSNKTETPHKIGMLRPSPGSNHYSWLLTPSFLSLKRNLGMENVISF